MPVALGIYRPPRGGVSWRGAEDPRAGTARTNDQILFLTFDFLFRFPMEHLDYFPHLCCCERWGKVRECVRRRGGVRHLSPPRPRAFVVWASFGARSKVSRPCVAGFSHSAEWVAVRKASQSAADREIDAWGSHASRLTFVKNRSKVKKRVNKCLY